MAVLSMTRIATLLDTVGVTEQGFVSAADDPVTIARLFKLQRQLDRLQTLIARIEAQASHRLGPPDLMVTLPDRSVVRVRTATEIDALVRAGQVSPKARDRLIATLADRISRLTAQAEAYRPSSLPRHEVRLGRKLDRMLQRYFLRPPMTIAGVRTRLVLLIAGLEPGLATDCLGQILVSPSLRYAPE